MIVESSDKLHFLHAAGIEDLAHYIETTPTDHPFKDPARWIGRGDLRSPQATADAIRAGWTDGEREILEIIQDIPAMPPPHDIRRRRRFGDVDGEVLPERVIGGDPLFLARAVRQHVHGPAFVRILVGPVVSAGSAAIEASRIGAAAVALSLLLESAGWSTCIEASWNARDSHLTGHDMRLNCDVKPYGVAVDTAQLAAVLSGWFLRTGVFSLIGSFPRRCSSYGWPGNPVTTGSPDTERLITVPTSVRYDNESIAQFLKATVEVLTEEQRHDG